MHNCELQYASLVNNRFSIVFESLSLTICSIPINLKSDKSCGDEACFGEKHEACFGETLVIKHYY